MLNDISGMPAGIRALEATGTVVAADYERAFAPLDDQMRRAGSRMRLLFQFGAGFQRMTLGALLSRSRYVE
ncbi:hypothetical protein A5753_12240 [Mycobacterium sp. 852002-51971_SCH5477799-a]|nr:hypothetical protein A5753_12240 [Mycobacterium sp. 852002-51971_SCH5477799-a]